jgi:hypothetical protein
VREPDLGGVDLVVVQQSGVAEPAIGGLGPLPRLGPDQTMPFMILWMVARGATRQPRSAQSTTTAICRSY